MVYPYIKQDLVVHLDAYDPQLRQAVVCNQALAFLDNFDHLNVPKSLEVVDCNAVGYFGSTSRKCPGGSRIFKVENDGQVKVCNYTWSHGMFNLGNIKSRKIQMINEDIVCPSVNNASCFLNMSKRFNLFPEYIV